MWISLQSLDDNFQTEMQETWPVTLDQRWIQSHCAWENYPNKLATFLMLLVYILGNWFQIKPRRFFFFCFSATIFWRMLLNRSEELFASKAFCKSLLQINLANFDTSFTLEGGSRHHSTFTYMWQTVIQ